MSLLRINRKPLWLGILQVIVVFANAQNLVSNGDFELKSSCPNSSNQLNHALGWFAVKGTPDYCNSCSSLAAITVPYNTYTGYQPDYIGGGAYGAVYTTQGTNDDREFIGTKLLDTLRTGHKYIAGIHISRANYMAYAIKTVGMLFTDSIIALPGIATSFTPNAQVESEFILEDTTNWILVQDTFTLTYNSIYLTIGNFKLDSTSDTTLIPSNYNYFNGSYYYIDGVSVYDVTGGVCNTYWDAGFDKYIFAGDSIRLGAIDTDNSVYVWTNSVGGATYLSGNADARPWSSPMITTTYYVTKTCPDNTVFNDTVTVFVTDSNSMGIGLNKSKKEEIKIYPNPSHDKIFIEGKGEAKLFNLLGREIFTTRQKEIDVSQLPGGIYFVSVKSEEGTTTKKIIVQH